MMLGYTEAKGHSIHGKHHTFALVLDPASDQGFVVRAGPTMSILGTAFSGPAGSASATAGVGGDQSIAGSGFGAIRASYGIFSNERRPYDKPQLTLAYQMLGRSNMSFSTIKAAMQSYANNINQRSIPYFPTGPNSNSFAFSFAEAMGYQRPRPTLPSTGWDEKLRTKK